MLWGLQRGEEVRGPQPPSPHRARALDLGPPRGPFPASRPLHWPADRGRTGGPAVATSAAPAPRTGLSAFAPPVPTGTSARAVVSRVLAEGNSDSFPLKLECRSLGFRAQAWGLRKGPSLLFG